MEKIEQLEKRAMELELEYPNFIENDYAKLSLLKIPEEVELTPDNESVMIIKTKSGPTTFTCSPIAFRKDAYEDISYYLNKEISKNNKIWIRRIVTHKQGNKYTVLDKIGINKDILR